MVAEAAARTGRDTNVAAQLANLHEIQKVLIYQQTDSSREAQHGDWALS